MNSHCIEIEISGLSKDLRNQCEVLNISKTDTKQQGDNL